MISFIPGLLYTFFNMADPLSWITGIGGLLGGIGSSIFSNSAMNKQLMLQQQENEKNRQFNAQQAKLAREYNTQMVREQNDYNLPTNVVKRLKDAGIHPALAFGNGTMPLSSVGVGGTASASSSGSVGTSLPDYSGLSMTGSSLANVANVASTLADADYKRELANLTAEQAQYYPQIAKGQITLNNSQVQVNLQNVKLTRQEEINLCKQLDVLDQSIVESKAKCEQYLASVRNLDADTISKQIDNFFKSENWQLQNEKLRHEINEIDSRINLTNQQANEIVQLLAYKQMLMQSQSWQASSAGNKADYETRSIQKEYERLFAEVERDKELIPLYTTLEKVITNNQIDIRSEWEAKYIDKAAYVCGAVGNLLGGATQTAVGKMIK